MTIHISNEKSCECFRARICMAGQIEQAKAVLVKYVFDNPICVNISPCTYIYRGGMEDGFIVELINYPRCPASWEALLKKAEQIAEELLVELGQDSFLIMGPKETKWKTRRPKETL